MRAGDKAGYDVAQHEGLLEFLEDKRHDARADQDERKVGNERCKVGLFTIS